MCLPFRVFYMDLTCVQGRRSKQNKSERPNNFILKVNKQRIHRLKERSNEFIVSNYLVNK